MTDTKIEVPELDATDIKEVEENLTSMMVARYKERLSMWMKDHKSHQKFPVEKSGPDMVWLNRAERRSKKLK